MEDRFANICINCFADKGLRSTCPSCHFSETEDVERRVMRPRTLIGGHYLIGSLLFKPGGFGITYKGLDLENCEVVAIKEYFPMDAAERAADGVGVRPGDAEIFAHGLSKFEDEARRLETLRNVAYVVEVRGFFEENATAYIVMPYYDGCNLFEYVENHNGRLPEKDVRVLAGRLARGLSEVHQHGLLHRDIKPTNIYITANRRPILLDFGSARFAIREKTHSLSVFVTEGFAPFEQYQTRGKQGPWTDIYGLSATLYFALTGEAPPQAPDRWENDQLQPLRKWVPKISKSLEEAIQRGLAVRVEDRPQSMAEFIEILGPTSAEGVEITGESKTSDTEINRAVSAPTPSVEENRSPKGRLAPFSERLLALACIAIAWVALAMAFDVPVSVLSIIAYVTLCYVVYMGWGDRNGISFWALCIPIYNVWCLAKGTNNAGPPESDASQLQDASSPAVYIVFDSGSWKGSGLLLGDKQTILGRDPSAHLRLDTPEVSRRHVAVHLDSANPGTIIVKDLGSSNGTFVAERSHDGTWSSWRRLVDEIHIPAGSRQRYRVRLGKDGDRFHLE